MNSVPEKGLGGAQTHVTMSGRAKISRVGYSWGSSQSQFSSCLGWTMLVDSLGHSGGACLHVITCIFFQADVYEYKDKVFNLKKKKDFIVHQFINFVTSSSQ